MDKILETYGEQGIVGLVVLGLFAIGCFFLLVIERVANSRTELLKFIINKHSDERVSWLDVIKQVVSNNHKEDQ